MKTLIVTYSRTGMTRKLARAVADILRADSTEIRCERYRTGFVRYLRAGFDSVRGNLPPIDVSAVQYQDYDLVLLAAPVWTSYPALPLRAFLNLKPDLPERVGLILTHGGHSPVEKAVAHVQALLPRPLCGTLCVNQEQVQVGDFSTVLEAFVDRLGKPVVPSRSDIEDIQ